MNENDGFFVRLAEIVDPHRQSFLFFRYTMGRVFLLAVFIGCMFYFRESGFVQGLLSNVFVYLPNYLIHEFAHRITGAVTFSLSHSVFGGCSGLDGRACYPVASWLMTIAGNGVECLVPAALILLSLRLKGGRWLLPALLYWSATTWYDAAVYVSDARASRLALTSSDMMTSYAPGSVKGDWHYILQPLGLLGYDVLIGWVFFAIASVLVVFAFYSVWYYWTHMDDFLKENPVQGAPSYSSQRARVTLQDYQQDPFAGRLARHSLPQGKEDVNDLYPRGPNEPPL